jgi:hypothetical protein
MWAVRREGRWGWGFDDLKKYGSNFDYFAGGPGLLCRLCRSVFFENDSRVRKGSSNAVFVNLPGGSQKCSHLRSLYFVTIGISLSHWYQYLSIGY